MRSDESRRKRAIGSGNDRHSIDHLFAAVCRGDPGEFDRLMNSYRPFLASIIRRGMDAKLRSVLEPEDVMQDVMLSAYRGIAEANFASDASFRSWLQTLAQNRLADLFRRHFKTQRRISSALSLDETTNGPDGRHRSDGIPAKGPGTTTLVSRREAVERVEALLALVRPKDRELVRLAFIELVPTSEIAARLGMKPEAVRKRYSRVLDSCRVAFRRFADRNGGSVE
ncbi:MAG: sigma-70 family RNA polymerase sigma factor [Planctomycetes bacterium]|nr:sigma-70 family RNA polymerase sigma factor [Planctomycetota bacterium]MBI3845305.1 sigma-70 family RNA polymerase sigma factor [Planctomycetota bacterium]